MADEPITVYGWDSKRKLSYSKNLFFEGTKLLQKKIEQDLRRLEDMSQMHTDEFEKDFRVQAEDIEIDGTLTQPYLCQLRLSNRRTVE